MPCAVGTVASDTFRSPRADYLPLCCGERVSHLYPPLSDTSKVRVHNTTLLNLFPPSRSISTLMQSLIVLDVVNY